MSAITLRNFVVTAGLATVLAVSPAQLAHAQTGKKPAVKKPTASKPAAPPKTDSKQPIVLGTTQIPGDFGKIGQTYTIGKRDPINFTLDSVRYTADRFTVGTNTWVPKDDEKLLVLRFTVHNPLPREQNYYWAGIKFTAVDATDTNREFLQTVRRAGVQDGAFSASLKPAQKVQLETAILVPANGITPKLIVEREQGAPVVRFDLHDKAEKLPAFMADPADPDDVTVFKNVPVKAGEIAPLGAFDVKLEAVAYTDEALGGREVKKGYRNVAATFTLKNATGSKQRYYWGDFDIEGRDAEGEKVPYTQAMLKASRNEATDGHLEPGEEVRVRFYFPVPKDVDAKSISLKERLFAGSKGRALVFDLAGSGTTTTAAAQ